jgi:hypothetical protein
MFLFFFCVFVVQHVMIRELVANLKWNLCNSMKMPQESMDEISGRRLARGFWGSKEMRWRLEADWGGEGRGLWCDKNGT